MCPCRDPRPKILKYYHRNEFLSQTFKNYPIENEYGIKCKCSTTENPQINPTLEKVHQVTANFVHTFDLKTNYLDKDDHLTGTIEVTYFAVIRMYHSELQSKWCLNVTTY